MKLYEIGKELAAINDTLIDTEGEINPDLEKRLDELNLALTDKATGIRKWRAQLDGDETTLDAEIKRLQRMKKTTTNLRDRLEDYVKLNMEIAGTKKLVTTIGTFTIAKSPDRAEIVVPELIPETYLDIIPEHYELNEKRVKEDVLAGKDIPGTKLTTDRTHLRVK